MKYIISILFFLVSMLNAEVFYSKLEPIETYVVKAAVSGKVLYSNEDIEGQFAKNDLIIKIDSTLDEINLKEYNNKLENIKAMLSIENNYYERIKKVKTKSDFEKDTQKIKVINYKTQVSDLIITIENLKDQISKKKLIEKNRYISNIAIKKDDYVTPGTLLYEAVDLSKAKLEIFLPIEESSEYLTKKIYLDDNLTDLKISKLYKIADSKHISSYKAEIIIQNPKTFSRLVKIEFK